VNKDEYNYKAHLLPPRAASTFSDFSLSVSVFLLFSVYSVFSVFVIMYTLFYSIFMPLTYIVKDTITVC